MAKRTKIQGETIRFTIDATNYPVFDSIIVELAKYKHTVLKFSFPSSPGHIALSKDGNNYTGTISGSESSLLEGLYDLELTFLGSEIPKGQIFEYLQVNPEFK